MHKDKNLKSLTLIGRRSSLFTRLPLFHAEALGVTCGFLPVMHLTDLDPRRYGGHPALKLPVLQIGDELVFGARNICHCIVAQADPAAAARVHWLDRQRDALSMNAQELLGHAMSAQVQQVMGLQVSGLPADSLFFTKSMAGLQGALGWLDAHLEQVLATMPEDRLFSDFEVALFCLVEHFTFRATLDVSAWPSLQRFASQFARHPAAVATAYRYDATPA